MAIALIVAGVPMASVAPSQIRTKVNCPTVWTTPCAMAARLQVPTPMGKARRSPTRSTNQPAMTSPKAAAIWKTEAICP